MAKDKTTSPEDIDWSRSVAELAVDALVTAKVLGEDDFERAVSIVAEEINVRLALGDRPVP